MFTPPIGLCLDIIYPIKHCLTHTGLHLLNTMLNKFPLQKNEEKNIAQNEQFGDVRFLTFYAVEAHFNQKKISADFKSIM